MAINPFDLQRMFVSYFPKQHRLRFSQVLWDYITLDGNNYNLSVKEDNKIFIETNTDNGHPVSLGQNLQLYSVNAFPSLDFTSPRGRRFNVVPTSDGVYYIEGLFFQANPSE